MIVPSSILTESDHDRLSALTRNRDSCTGSGDASWILRQKLQRGCIVEPQKIDRDIVTMNSQVQVRDLKSRSPTTWTLVFPADADFDEGRLSVLSPLGMAILGAKVGQVVEFQAPGAERRVKVERILYQPEAAGDFHL